MTTSAVGWGGGPWGLAPWGSGVGDLHLVAALAVRENVVRLTFDLPVYFSELLDPSDASDPERFSVTPDTSTTGLDGLPARPVFPCEVRRALVAGSGGTILDVVLDRPLSPYPALYLAAGNNLKSAAGSLIDPAAASLPFLGLQQGAEPKIPSLAVGRRDIANPQSLGMLLAAGVSEPAQAELAGFPVDETGDYAADRGLESLKKRLFRRMMTLRGRFAHLPGYGVGLPGLVKRLASESARASIRSDAEAQARLEPEVLAARADLFQVPGTSTWVLRLRVRTATGEQAVQVPLTAT